jgi:hypothetical protein
MDEHITKQQAIEAFDNPTVDWNYGDVSPESVIRVIEALPAADVCKVIHAYWIYDDFDDDLIPYQCSNCKSWTRMNYDFCPNCGADMRRIK